MYFFGVSQCMFVHFETRFLGEYVSGIASSSANLFAFPASNKSCVCFLFHQPLGTPTSMKRHSYNVLSENALITSAFGNHERSQAHETQGAPGFTGKIEMRPNSRLGSCSLGVWVWGTFNSIRHPDAWRKSGRCHIVASHRLGNKN